MIVSGCGMVETRALVNECLDGGMVGNDMIMNIFGIGL